MVRERAAVFKTPIPSGTRQEFPEFFVVDTRQFAIEVAWRTDKNSKPMASIGTRRYPIGYSATSDSARTNTGVHFSGPYVSDAARHGISQASGLNDLIDGACRDALVEVMASHLLQRHGGKAMELYIDDKPGADDGSLEDLVSRTIDKRALPLERRETKPFVRSKSVSSKPNKRISRRAPLGPRRLSDGSLANVVLPMFTWLEDGVSSLLSDICPATYDKIDKSVPRQILRQLHQGNNTITFDEVDAIQRMQPEAKASHFPWECDAEWQKVLGDVAVAMNYLDVIYETIQQGQLDSEPELAANMYLPDEYSSPRPLRTMHSAVNLPPNLTAHESVPILHVKLQGHPLLKRRGWKPRSFKIDDYVEMARLEEASVEHRQTFWDWLRNNGKKVNTNQLRKIRALPVWPREDGILLPFDDLCKPQSRRIESILRDDIQLPSSLIFRPGLVQRKGNSRLRFRREVRTRRGRVFSHQKTVCVPGRAISDVG